MFSYLQQETVFAITKLWLISKVWQLIFKSIYLIYFQTLEEDSGLPPSEVA